MKKIKNFEILRKCWHTLFGLIIVGVFLSHFFSKETFSLLLFLLFISSLIFEYFRTSNHGFNKVVLQFTKSIMRKHELNSVSGLPYYLLGCFIVVFFCSMPVAILSILYLAIGDSFASFSGRKWGELSLKFKNGKSLIGLIGAIISCNLIGFLYLSNYCSYSFKDNLFISLIGGIIGGVAESINILDDNLFVPVFSGFFLSILFSYILK
jgi:dolichol kinase